MDTLENYRQIIERTLEPYTKPPLADEKLTTEIVFDRVHDRYLLVEVGWLESHRIHNVLAHLEIVNGKIWVQEDNIGYGVTQELEAAGVPKENIVLGFKSPFLRQFTEYAAA